MAIFVKTKNPSELIKDINEQIDKKQIDTWMRDTDGDYTHNTDQWRFHAWIRSRIETGRVVFYIICRKDKNLTVFDYAIYHGRFVEMLLSHFDKSCESIEVSSLASSYDIVSKE